MKMWNQFLEYVKLVPKVIKNRDAFIQGITNNVRLNMGLLPEDQQDEVIKRRVICNTCPYNSENAKDSEEYKELYDRNYITDRLDLHCAHCGCNIEFKTAALDENCGNTYWNTLHPEKPLELLWETYKPNTND